MAPPCLQNKIKTPSVNRPQILHAVSFQLLPETQLPHYVLFSKLTIHLQVPIPLCFYNHRLKFTTLFFQNSCSISVTFIVQLFPAQSRELNEYLVSKHFWLISLEKGREKSPKIMDLTRHTCDTTGQ